MAVTQAQIDALRSAELAVAGKDVEPDEECKRLAETGVSKRFGMTAKDHMRAKQLLAAMKGKTP
jgi:hypothetical protein